MVCACLYCQHNGGRFRCDCGPCAYLRELYPNGLEAQGHVAAPSMSESEFVQWWRIRIDFAERDHEPVYVTPEEYKNLRDYAIEKEVHGSFEDFGGAIEKQVHGSFGGAIGDFPGTPMVVDADERELQIKRLIHGAANAGR